MQSMDRCHSGVKYIVWTARNGRKNVRNLAQARLHECKKSAELFALSYLYLAVHILIAFRALRAPWPGAGRLHLA